MNTSVKNKQLTSLDVLSNKQLNQIAELIYDTDPYIYPAMFQCKEDGIAVISRMIQYDDSMFKRDNLYVSMIDSDIVGIILWYKGRLNWNTDICNKCIDECNVLPSQYIDTVRKEYFSSYDKVDDSRVSIINVCVSNKYRNQRIGSSMLHDFMKIHVNEVCELFVLKDDIAAIHLYENNGFKIIEELQGFSVEKIDLPCLRMVRT